MGAADSSPGGSNELILKKGVDELYFLPRNLSIFFEQYTKKQMKPGKSDSFVETALFPIIIEQILLYQSSPGKLYVHPNFENRVFGAIRQLIQPFIVQASPFADRFRYIENLMENHIQAEIQKMETEWKQHAKFLVFDTGSSAQTPVVLQATMNVFFEIVQGFDKLDIDVVDQLLEGLIGLVTSEDCPTVLGVSPVLISKFNSFLVDLSLSSKFATNKIKSKVITFLMHIAKIQGGISTVLAALTVAMTAEASTPFEGSAPKQVMNIGTANDPVEYGSLFGTKVVVKNINSDIYSCAATMNHLWMVVDSGLYEVNLKGEKETHIGVPHPSRTLVTCNPNRVLLFDVAESSVTSLCLNEFFHQDKTDLSSEIPPGSKIVGIAEVTDCPLLFVVREVAAREYEIGAFNLERQGTKNVFKERKTVPFEPKFVLPSKSSIHLYAPGHDTVLRCSIAKNENGSEFCFKNIEYAPARALHHEGGFVTSSEYMSYVFVREGSDIGIYRYNVKYGDVLPFPEFAKPKPEQVMDTFNGFIVKTISDMTIPLCKTVQYVFLKLTPTIQQYLQFFASSPMETIMFALSLGNQSLTSDLAPPETRQRMLFFAVMLLAINGRCYAAQFPLNSFSFDEADLELQKEFREFIEKTVFHPLASPEIVAAVFQTIKATFHVIYYPNYGDFRDFLDRFVEKPKLLALALPFLRASSPLFYALDHQILSLVKPYLTHQNICYITHERIRCINAELHFLKTHNITAHERYIARFVSALFDYYTDSLCTSELFTKMQYSSTMIIRIFTQVLVLDSAPIVSVSFAQSCLRLFKKIHADFTPSSADLQTDLEFSSISDTETTQKRVKTFETMHPYQDGQDLEMRIEMPGATEIEIEFDRRCATEDNTDYLQIYDRSEGGSLVGRNLSGPEGAANWPRKLTVQSDSCRIFFHADESTNDWGIRLVISAHVSVTMRQFQPNVCLSMMNLISYAIGRSLQQALISIPVTEHEEENKIILESGILQGAHPIFRSNEMKQAAVQIHAIVDKYKPLRGGSRTGVTPKPNRSLSERLFEECVTKENFSTSKHTEDARQTSLLVDLTSEVLPENSAAALLMKRLYESLHKQLIKMMPLSSVVERFACAAFIKMLGVLSLSWSIGKELIQYTANPSGRAKPPIPFPLDRIVKALYSIRTSLYFAFQKSNLPNDNPKLLRENYEEYARQMLLKSKFLLLCDTVFYEKDEVLDENKLDKSISLLLSFITSGVRFEEIERMVGIRVSRAKTRIRAMEITSEFLGIQDLLQTAQISFLSPLVNAFPAVVDKASIQSISNQLMETYDSKCADLHRRFTESLSKKDGPNALRLLLLRTLLFPTHSIVKGQENVKSLLDFLSGYAPKTIDELAFSEGLWLFVTNIAVQNRNSEICDFLQTLLQRTEVQEPVLFKVMNLQSVLVLDGFYEKSPLQFYFDLLKNGTPRMFVAVFQFLACFFSTYGISPTFEVVFDNEKLNLEHFVEKILKFIAKTKIYEPMPVLPAGAPLSSHQMVADEFVAFFRVLLTPASKASHAIGAILQSIMNRITQTGTLENLMKHHELALYFLALLLVFGEGMQAIFEGGHAFVTNGDYKEEFIKITTYSSMSDSVGGYSLGKSLPVRVDLKSVTPTTRFPCNLRSFEFTEDTIVFFEKFRLSCQKIISVNAVHNNHVLLFSLINAFYCFIPLVIQNPTVMVNFLKFSNLDSWLDFSVLKTKERRLHSISEMTADITDVMGQLATEESAKQMEVISNWVKKQQELKKHTPPEKYVFDRYQSMSQYNHLLFSILPFKDRLFSPDGMAVLYGYGKVEGLVGSTPSTATFVGNRNVPSTHQFYWEAKISTNASKPRFTIGFMDHRPTEKSYEMFSLTFPERELASPTTGAVKMDEQYTFQSGDVLGVALARNQVSFFRNGMRFSKSIPSPHLGDFTPFIAFTSTEATFEFNFGERHFTTDLVRETIFDIYEKCTIEMDTKIQDQVAVFTSDSYTDPSYVDVFKKAVTAMKGPRRHPRDTETFYPKKPDHKPSPTDVQTPFTMENRPSSNEVCVAVGSPCRVCRTRLPPKEVHPNETIVFSTAMKEKLEHVGIVRKLIPKAGRYSAVLDFCDPGIGVVETLEFDSRFLTPGRIRRHAGTEFGHEQIIRSSYLRKRAQEFMNNKDVFVTTITEGLCLTRALTIRMARYTLLLVMDYLRSKKTGFELFKNEKIVSLLSILILELTSFSPSVRINAKWSQNVSTDAVFVGTTSNTIFVTDSSKMLKKLRSVLYSIYQCEDETDLFSALFDSALKTLFSDSDQPDVLINMAPPHLRFESTRPCASIVIQHTVKVPSAVGFVPVVASTCDIPEPGINAANIVITGRQDEIRFITGNHFDIRGNISRCSFGGLALAFFPVERWLCDSALPQPAGAIHLIFSLLSLVFSYNLSAVNKTLCHRMKAQLLPSFLKILKDGGVFGTIFAFEFVAPLLSHIEWKFGDLTSPTLFLIREYLKNFEDSVTEWKLSVAAQHATLLNMLFDLTVIDATTRNIVKPHDIHSNVISDQSVESAKYVHMLSFLYETLNQKLHQKPSCVFHEVTEVFTRVAALAHNWSFPIKFPSFLLLDSFLSSVQHDPIVINSYTNFRFTETEAIQNVCVPYAKTLTMTVEGCPRVDVVNQNDERCTYVVVPGARTRVYTNSIQIRIPKNLEKFEITIHLVELTPLGRENLFITHIDEFLANCQFMEQKWNQKIDETLLKIMNQNPQLSSDKGKFTLSSTQLVSNSVLHDVPPALLAARVELIKQLNSSVTRLLKCVDLGDNQVLSAAVIAAKSAINTSYKLDLFRKCVMTHLDDDQRLNLSFNRSRAALHMTNPSHPDAMPLIRQLIDQVPIRSLKALKRDSVPWHVDLIGEGATDAGGPARDLFTQMCLEVMHPSTGLFIMTPNKRAARGPNQELLIPNSYSNGAQHKPMFIYTGVLMTIAFISRLPQPFKFVEFLWAHFTGAQMTIEDIYSIDSEFELLMRQVDSGEIDDVEAERRGLSFTVRDSHGETVELFPGGSGVRVTKERMSEYSQMCKKLRLREMKLQLDWLKEGISYFFPPDALFLLSPWELELIVCGDNTVPVSELKKHCKFDAKDKSSKMLWQVLEKFSPEERMLFIKFATGRMGLPPPGSKWHSDLTISWVQSNVKDDAAMPLPTAATCSSTIRIPRYTTKAWMAKKIRAAIVFGVDIDTDRQVNFADIVQLT